MEPKFCPRCGTELTIEHSVWKVKAYCQQCHCYEWLETATSEPDEPKKTEVNEPYHQYKERNAD